jgi:hypothetical protein
MRHRPQALTSPPPSQWPIDLRQYDRTPTLSEAEWQAVKLFCTFISGDRWSLHPVELGHLHRLLSQINDVLTLIGTCYKSAAIVRREMVRGMFRQHSAFWGWSEEQWVEVIKVVATGRGRHHMIAVGYLLGGLTELHHIGKWFFQTRLASRVFGPELTNEAVTSVRNALTCLGYCSLPFHDAQRLVCEALLANRSPLLRDLTTEGLEQLRHGSAAQFIKEHVIMLSHALRRITHQCTAYPQCANQARASDSVIEAKASLRACSNASTVRAFAFLSEVLIFDQHFSIGLRSGE